VLAKDRSQTHHLSITKWLTKRQRFGCHRCDRRIRRARVRVSITHARSLKLNPSPKLPFFLEPPFLSSQFCSGERFCHGIYLMRNSCGIRGIAGLGDNLSMAHDQQALELAARSCTRRRGLVTALGHVRTLSTNHEEEELACIYKIPIPLQRDLPISCNIGPSQDVLAICFRSKGRKPANARSIAALGTCSLEPRTARLALTIFTGCD
jgi:hypothetical protein